MNLNAIFSPRSIAIVGASTKVGTVGNDIVKNLIEQGFEGDVFPVNHKADELFGRKCYASILDIEKPVDLVIIVVPAAITPDVMLEAAKKGVKGAIVISAGFKEIGNIDLENRLRDICVENDIALIGPNCLGAINPAIKMNASFATLMPEVGSVAFFSQSGALCTAVLDYAEKLGIGFSKFVSMGNKAMTDEVAVLEYLLKDDATKVIALYAEDLKNPQSVIEVVKKLQKNNPPKPVIILKSGRTSAGASASASHTGSLAGNDAAYDALFEQSGMIRAGKVSELFEYIQVFANNPLPQGKNVAIITNAGGPGVLTTDEVISQGLELAQLSENTISELKSFLPPAANPHNPVDVLGDAKADRYASALKKVVEDVNVDSLLVLLTPQSTTEIEATADAIIEIKKVSKKPIVVSFMGEITVSPGVKKMLAAGISAINFPEQAAKALSVLTQFSDRMKEKEAQHFSFSNIQKEKVQSIFAEARARGKTSFPEAEALPIFEAYGFPLLKSQVVKTAEEAMQAAASIGSKLVMKIVSQDILHKSDVGGVMLNVLPEEVGSKFEEMMERVQKNMPNARLEGVLLVEMAEKGGAEIILGSSKDPSLGSMLMVGFGGIYVEVFKDVVFGLAPLTQNDASKMLQKLKSYKILEGVRGQATLDIPALLDCIGRLSQLLTDFPEIQECDINPLLVLPEGKGVRLLDARIVIE